MKYFQDHDGFITIQVDNLIYTAPVEEFVETIGLDYDLPEGYISSYYEPGVSHYLVRKSDKWDPNNREYLDPSWDKGDTILSKIEELINKKNAKLQAEIEEREAKRREYLEQYEAQSSNPMAKYTNFLQTMQSSGLMDRLSTSKNMGALTTLLLNSGILFDDDRIQSSIELILLGMEQPLTSKEKTLFNSILNKNGFEFKV